MTFGNYPTVCGNELYGDFGHHCFTVKWFNNVFPHRVNLSIIHRQTDQMLITAVNELENGKPSDLTIAFIQSSIQLFFNLSFTF